MFVADAKNDINMSKAMFRKSGCRVKLVTASERESVELLNSGTNGATFGLHYVIPHYNGLFVRARESLPGG